MKKNPGSNSFLSAIGGLLFPVISFGYCLYKPNNKGLRLVYVLFFAFLGLSMFFDKEGTDVLVYVDHFRSATTMDVSYAEYIKSVTFGGLDFYWTFMTWLVSRFTDNPHIFLGALTAVYGFFVAANTCYIIEKVGTSRNTAILLLLFVFTPGFLFLYHRWWTAMQVFEFGLLPILFEKKYKRIVFCVAAAFLIHFSFIYPLLILLSSIILPQKSVYPYLIVYYILSIASELDLSIISNNLAFILPSEYIDRTTSYINAEIQEHNFFSTSYDLFLKTINIVIVSYICFKDKVNDKDVKRILIIVLMIASLAEVCAMTEWGWRYLRLSGLSFYAFYMFYYRKAINIEGYKKLLNLCTPFYIYCLLFQIWGFTTIIGLKHFLLGNYFSIWFMGEENISLFDSIH